MPNFLEQERYISFNESEMEGIVEDLIMKFCNYSTRPFVSSKKKNSPKKSQNLKKQREHNFWITFKIKIKAKY